jgi:hypothetical protein
MRVLCGSSSSHYWPGWRRHARRLANQPLVSRVVQATPKQPRAGRATFKLEVKVPVGASASVVLPFGGPAQLDGVVTAPDADGSLTLESGDYVFTVATQ